MRLDAETSAAIAAEMRALRNRVTGVHGSVLAALLTLRDVQFAWNLAHSLALDSDRTGVS